MIFFQRGEDFVPSVKSNNYFAGIARGLAGRSTRGEERVSYLGCGFFGYFNEICLVTGFHFLI